MYFIPPDTKGLYCFGTQFIPIAAFCIKWCISRSFYHITNSVASFFCLSVVILLPCWNEIVRQGFHQSVAAPNNRLAPTQKHNLTSQPCPNEITWKRLQSAVGPHQ